MDLGLKGRKAAVAGASRGLGYAAAQALAAEGAQVAICARHRETVEQAAAHIGGGAVALVADVSTAVGARGFVTAAEEALGEVDILVANAGSPPIGTFQSTPLDEYVKAFELNWLSTIAMCDAAVPAMCERGWGRVIAITSIGVRDPVPETILSNTARVGLTGFLKTVALEVVGHGVTVNSVQPGLHDTDDVESLITEDSAARAPARLGRPVDFGAIVAFLCSEQAAYITGAAIPVDGGAYEGLL